MIYIIFLWDDTSYSNYCFAHWLTTIFIFILIDLNRHHPNDTTPYHYYEEKDGKKECEYYQQSETHLTFGHLFITEKAIFARWAQRYNIKFRYPEWNATMYNSTNHLDTPFLKLYKEAQHNKTMKEGNKKGRGPAKPKGPPLIGPKTKEEAEKEKYQKFTHAVMFIVAIFLSLVVFLLLFLLASLFVFCFYLWPNFSKLYKKCLLKTNCTLYCINCFYRSLLQVLVHCKWKSTALSVLCN